MTLWLEGLELHAKNNIGRLDNESLFHQNQNLDDFSNVPDFDKLLVQSKVKMYSGKILVIQEAKVNTLTRDQ
ncbi:uncharacterized protein PADG_11142 [Paracoccidioides brasiliensis Pb18]|uniref:Uncharacterized protein n=2 Tax=Paracoccidioides brasiliensis TaxID=121759 RepID=A0A0A0HZB5_PARBD|nr:uncharacterized protein PADG_11142 [Paracoccidioides brasiliensis Pb18]KGM92685.1 hypothetical protein PADG_11142 [Paracoccidioides brasiliensis Pb18]ODH42627.1 hypothetical protein ACO22_01152 [Paracoccidioides brasiliensis]